MDPDDFILDDHFDEDDYTSDPDYVDTNDDSPYGEEDDNS